MAIKVYTDGACTKLGQGGWAVIIDTDTELSGGTTGTTNNRMEMQGPLSALEFLDKKRLPEETLVIEIYCDSAYVVNCFLKGWYINWRRNGWLNSQGNDVENQDLWKKLLEFYENEHLKITWVKVKGHSTDELNNRCDLLAKEAVIRVKKEQEEKEKDND